MPEGITTESLAHDIMEAIHDGVSRHSDVPFFEGDSSKYVKSQVNRLFGRDKPVHHLLGGGKSADLFLWKNKTISAGALTGATIVWLIFEWLDYHFLTLASFVLFLGMIVQFVWSNASGFINRSQGGVPRLVLPEEYFVHIGRIVGVEVNRALDFLQDVSCGGSLKQFLLVAASLWAAAIIGTWCNFLTLIYIGFIAAHTLPVLYDRYEDEVDGFVSNVVGQLQHNYRKLDTSVLSRIPKAASFRTKKWD